MRVVIANCYPDDNRGSAALNDAACLIAERAFPGAAIALISAARGACAMTGAALRAPFRHSLAAHPRVAVLPPVLPTRRAADLVLSRGGYLLADPGGLRWRLNPYLLMLPNRLAHRLGKPTWTLPTSVIPARGWVGDLALRHLVRSFDRLALRDPKARAAAVALGGRNVAVYGVSL